VHRSGRDLTIITYAAMVYEAEKAANELAQEGIETEIIDLRTVLPYDKELVLESVRRCNRVIVLHEDTLTNGIGGDIAAFIAQEAFESLDAPVTRMASLDTPVPFSPPLEKAFLPNAEKILIEARKLLAY
jgi:2-oxoisovalerate dehydrogenase E1 component beta subunit